MPLTSFVGRRDDIALAMSLLRRPDIRLLTVTGPGGIGKTRLAIEIGAAIAADFVDGVRFISLASVPDPSGVMMAIAAGLGLGEFDGATIDDIVAASLRRANALLIIDNFEHVVDAAPVVTGLLGRCPQLKIMVTSRRLLRVEGEHALPAPPLTAPRDQAGMSSDDWRQVPVIRLFIERAEAVDPSRAWEQDDVLRLVEICDRLEGLPLAVELAATRVRHLTLAEINDRLDEQLPLLIDGSRDQPGRLQTMRNAIAWSYDLLSPDARRLLRQVSVFNGGFSLKAIASVSDALHPNSTATGADDAVSQTGDVDRAPSIDAHLSTLIDSSLMIRETGPIAGTTRYRLLETIREFGWEQAEAHGEASNLRRTHAAYYANFAELHEYAEPIPEHLCFIDQLVVEQPNLRYALTRLVEAEDQAPFVRLVATLGRFWLARSNYFEARTWFGRALAIRSNPISADTGKILVLLGMTELFQEEYEMAEIHLEKGLAGCRQHAQAHGAAQALVGLAGLAVERGDGERSIRLLEEAKAAVAAIEDIRLAGVMSGWVSINLAVASRRMGDLESARLELDDAVVRCKAEQFDVGTMMALGDLGDLARDRGEWMRALSLYKEALAVRGAGHAKRLVIEIVESVATIASRSGELELSATLLAAAEGLRERIGLRYRPARNRSSIDEAIERARLGLPEASLLHLWDVGRRLTESQAISSVLEFIPDNDASSSHGLTARESEILRLLAMGMTDPAIAEALFISVRTVEHHVANVYRKLGVRTRAAATSTAIAAGLVATGGPA